MSVVGTCCTAAASSSSECTAGRAGCPSPAAAATEGSWRPTGATHQDCRARECFSPTATLVTLLTPSTLQGEGLCWGRNATLPKQGCMAAQSERKSVRADIVVLGNSHNSSTCCWLAVQMALLHKAGPRQCLKTEPS